MSTIIEKLQTALNEIKANDDMCKNQKETLEKALVMLRTKWENNEAVNIKYCIHSGSFSPAWNWHNHKYSIIEPKEPEETSFPDIESQTNYKDALIKSHVDIISHSIAELIKIDPNVELILKKEDLFSDKFDKRYSFNCQMKYVIVFEHGKEKTVTPF